MMYSNEFYKIIGNWMLDVLCSMFFLKSAHSEKYMTIGVRAGLPTPNPGGFTPFPGVNQVYRGN